MEITILLIILIIAFFVIYVLRKLLFVLLEHIEFQDTLRNKEQSSKTYWKYYCVIPMLLYFASWVKYDKNVLEGGVCIKRKKRKHELDTTMQGAANAQ